MCEISNISKLALDSFNFLPHDSMEAKLCLLIHSVRMAPPLFDHCSHITAVGGRPSQVTSLWVTYTEDFRQGFHGYSIAKVNWIKPEGLQKNTVYCILILDLVFLHEDRQNLLFTYKLNSSLLIVLGLIHQKHFFTTNKRLSLLSLFSFTIGYQYVTSYSLSVYPDRDSCGGVNVVYKYNNIDKVGTVRNMKRSVT